MATTPQKPDTGCSCQKPAPHYPEQITGQMFLARCLKRIGTKTMYGLVGIPVTELGYLCQGEGIRFISFRFEQQAGMAAQTHGYLTKQPGILLTVSSLGFLNGLTALKNATVNCYPMIQISGSSDREPVDLEQGTYESLDQLATAKPLCKAAYRVNRPEDIPTAVVRAYRAAVSGRPGGVYLDMPTPTLAAIIDADKAEELIKMCDMVDPCPAMVPSEESVDRALALLASAKKPAIVIGKGAAYAQIDDKIKEFVEKTGIPYYPMSMAKGLLPDNHPQSALSCRKEIMKDCDVVILCGARLNWLLSRGHGDWNPNGQFIQLDIDPIEIDCNRHISAPVIGDLDSIFTALLAKLPNYKMQMDPTWMPYLQQITKEKNAKFAERLKPQTVPMTHWSALSACKKVLEANPDVILVNEGANTLDDCRDAIDMFLPRHRIDCATWAIMGMGMGSAIGAATATGKSVVAIEGDSAFGFSGMDYSSICRFKLPVCVVIFNNGGIYNNIGKPLDNTTDPAPTTLDLNARYDKLGEAFGSKNYYVTTPAELQAALTEAIASKEPCIINAQLAGDSGKESGHIGYLNPATLIPITV